MDVFKGVNVAVQIASAAVGATPGVATMVGGIPTPPGMQGLFAGAQTAVCVIVWLFVALFAKDIRSAGQHRITVTVIGLVVMFFAATAVYLGTYGLTVVTEPREIRGTDGESVVRNEQAYFPLVLTGDLKEFVEGYGSRVAAVEETAVATVNDRVRRHPLALHFTTTFLMAGYITLPATLVAMLALLGWRLSGAPPTQPQEQHRRRRHQKADTPGLAPAESR